MRGVRAKRTAMQARAVVLRRPGFVALLFDFQAHSESPGRHMTFERLEGLDAKATVAFAARSASGWV